MSDNPFESPEELEQSGRLPDSRTDKLRKIAFSQKGVIMCILGHAILYAFVYIAPPELRIIPQIAMLPVAIAGTVFVFMLSLQVYDKSTGIIFGILSLVPCVGS